MQRVFIGEDRVEPVNWERCKDTGRVCMCGGNFLEAAPLKLEMKGVRILEIRMKDLKIEENNSLRSVEKHSGHKLL